MNDLLLLISLIAGYLAPLGLVAGSTRTKDHEKNGWLIGTLFFSWLALLLYLTIVPKGGWPKKKKKRPRFESE